MKKIINKAIERAEQKYKDLKSICSVIADEAQKYIEKLECKLDNTEI